ncbi:CCA tRNA nucleotidyltransferase [Patescibacteria group bacterium]|nr:CCA tRNA nucleotidyltransferase [Patescibacteria group bacterium]
MQKKIKKFLNFKIMMFSKKKEFNISGNMTQYLESREFKKNLVIFDKIIKKFPQSEIYLVGGAVRDILLSRSTKDYDFVVRGVPADDLEEFLQECGTVNFVGQIFGVFKFILSGSDKDNQIDIALPRKDFALGTGGYRDVEIQSDPSLKIKEDLGRRDFTINAIAVKLNKIKLSWQVVDPFNGRLDLKKKLIRSVGEPNKRIKEDYSRMLRAIRFACQLDFDIEKNTWQAIKNNIKGLNEISRNVKSVIHGKVVEQEVLERRVVPHEVIAKEFLKSFQANPVRAFDLYDQSGAFKELIPEILKMKDCPQPENFHAEGDVWVHTRLALEKLTSPEFKKKFGNDSLSMKLILATLFHDLGKPPTLQTPERDGTDRIRFNKHDWTGAKITKKICQRLKLSSPEDLGVDINQVVWLVEQHMILARGDINQMRPSTIEKYFFNPNMPGKDLLKLFFADISATIPPSGQSNFTQFNQMLERIQELKELSKNKKELPRSLLNGHEIIKEFNLESGPRIGKLLNLLREKQLNKKIKNKKQAISFLKKYI